MPFAASSYAGTPFAATAPGALLYPYSLDRSEKAAGF
jgi:hypothetical protein